MNTNSAVTRFLEDGTAIPDRMRRHPTGADRREAGTIASARRHDPRDAIAAADPIPPERRGEMPGLPNHNPTEAWDDSDPSHPCEMTGPSRGDAGEPRR